MIKILRTQQITIDLPTPGAEPWLNITVQYVEMSDDFKPVNVVDRWGVVNAQVSSMAMSVFPLHDPVPVPDGSISGAGIITAFTMAVIGLIMAKYGGTFDPTTGYIILG